jgi:hypothetical protein
MNTYLLGFLDNKLCIWKKKYSVTVYNYHSSGGYPSSFYLRHNVSETGFRLCFQVEPTKLSLDNFQNCDSYINTPSSQIIELVLQYNFTTSYFNQTYCYIISVFSFLFQV